MHQLLLLLVLLLVQRVPLVMLFAVMPHPVIQRGSVVEVLHLLAYSTPLINFIVSVRCSF